MIRLLSFLVVFFYSALGFSAEFKEGVDYYELSTLKTKEPQILEFFSYFCPACYNFEPIVKKLKERSSYATALKAYQFEAIPVGFAKPIFSYLQKGQATAEFLKVDGQFADAVFDKIHRQRINLQSESDVFAIFDGLDIKEDKYMPIYKGFAVSGAVQKYNRLLEEYRIDSTPTFVINGKYKINQRALQSEKQFFELIQFLLNK